MSAADMLDGSLYDELDDDVDGIACFAGVVWALVFEAACIAAVFASIGLWRWTH